MSGHEHDLESPTTSGRIRKIEKDLYFGNGKPGITTRLELLEDAVDRIEQTLKDFQKGQDWLIRLVAGGLILAVLNMVIRK